MTWYVYIQNNSGGKWLPPAMRLVVEAADSASALARAQASGLDLAAPFCPCCGPRWSDYSEESAAKPTLDDLFYGPESSIYKGRGVPRAIYAHANGEVEVTP